jgi:hypothetical protein
MVVLMIDAGQTLYQEWVDFKAFANAHLMMMRRYYPTDLVCRLSHLFVFHGIPLGWLRSYPLMLYTCIMISSVHGKSISVPRQLLAVLVWVRFAFATRCQLRT